MNEKIFREYDIRGQAERDLSNEFAHKLGRALASHLHQHYQEEDIHILVGRDCRLTSKRLFDALTSGMRKSGAKVSSIGVVPTPLLYFAAHTIKSHGAVIITGSHNPSEDNGFKMLRGTASIFGDEIRSLKERILAEDYREVAEEAEMQECTVVDEYLDYAISTLKLGDRRGRIVVDAGNGAGGPIAKALYEKMGYEVVPLYCEMDGNFPNHHPDPTVEKNLEDLKAAVATHKAELGIALDGDGDRIGAVDSQGRVLWGDQLLILLGKELLKEVPGATIIGEVKCSQALYDQLNEAGAKALMSKVGHSLIKAKMKECSASLAGEMSGHIFFAHRFLGFDDGSYAGARLLELLSKSEKSLDSLYDELPQMVNTPEIRIPCPDEIKFQVVSGVLESFAKHDEVKSIVDIDGMRANFGEGWGLVRASNTQASLVMRCEAQSQEKLAHICQLIESEVQAVQSKLQANA